MSSPRRQFIKQVAVAGGAALVAPQIVFAQSPAKKLGVALVGLGYYSTDVLAPALAQAQHCYLAGIVTGSPEKAAAWQKKYQIPEKNTYNYQNFDQIANNPAIDVVYVVLPPSMHREYVVRAARAGKHVWCEKPMAPTVADCQAMIDACRQANRQLAIGYRCQHDPNTQELIKLRQAQKFGKVRLVSSHAGYFDGRSGHWKQQKAMGGGAMYDMGVYALQGARYATGEEPVAVLAQQHTTRPQIYTEVDETTLFQLEFPSGAVANCATSFGMSMNYLYVTCEKGWMKLEPFQSYGGLSGTTSGGQVINHPVANQQALQMDNDAQSIINNRPPLVPGEEGLRDIRVVEAIYRSAKEGKRVVI
jgi:glucose-fructose oxidoreductase